MTLVVPTVCRFALNQTLFGRAVVNVIDMHIDTTGSGVSRGDAIHDQAKILARQWGEDVMNNLTNQLTLDSVTWVDLNAADGETGLFSGDSDVTLPHPGDASGATLPPNVAMLVRKQLSGRHRGTRGGRMYVAGLTEEETGSSTGNRLNDTSLGTFVDQMHSFLGNVNQDFDGALVTYTSKMVVVHVGPSTSTTVDDLVPDGLLATQRDRLRG